MKYQIGKFYKYMSGEYVAGMIHVLDKVNTTQYGPTLMIENSPGGSIREPEFRTVGMNEELSEGWEEATYEEWMSCFPKESYPLLGNHLQNKNDLYGMIKNFTEGIIENMIPSKASVNPYELDSKLKVYFDMEFTGLHQNTTPISLGLVSESGASFYAEFTDYDRKQLNDWLNINIINRLLFNKKMSPFSNQVDERINNPEAKDVYSIQLKADTPFIRNKLLLWLSNESEQAGGKQIQFISDCYAYDWVLLNNLISLNGNAIEIPSYIHYIPIDLSTILWTIGEDPDVSREEFAGEFTIPNPIIDDRVIIPSKHNSLWDAWVIKACFDKITEHQSNK